MKHPQKLTCLVVSTPLKNMKVSWDNQIPKIWKNKSHVPNHQPVTLLRPKKTSSAPPHLHLLGSGVISCGSKQLHEPRIWYLRAGQRHWGKKVGDKNWMRSNKNLSVCVSNFLLIYILILMNFAFCHSNWERLKFKKLSIGLKYRYVSNCIIPKIDRNHPLDNPRRK